MSSTNVYSNRTSLWSHNFIYFLTHCTAANFSKLRNSQWHYVGLLYRNMQKSMQGRYTTLISQAAALCIRFWADSFNSTWIEDRWKEMNCWLLVVVCRERTGSGEQMIEASGREKPVKTRPVESTRTTVVSCVVNRSSCPSIMLRPEELPFIKTISSLHLSPALMTELRFAMSRRKKSALPAGSRSTMSGSGTIASRWTCSQLVEKQSQRAGKVGRLDGASQQEPSTWCWVCASAATSSVTGEEAAVGGWQPGPTKGGVTYAAVFG
jgi:hypothetical protein